MATSRSRRETSPTPMEFVQAWQTSSAVAEVASRLRMKKDQVRVRASRYRKKGVPLKQYAPAEVSVRDWDELAAFAASLVPEDESAAGGDQSPDGQVSSGASEGGDESLGVRIFERRTGERRRILGSTLPRAFRRAHRQPLHRRTVRQRARDAFMDGASLDTAGASQRRWRPDKGGG